MFDEMNGREFIYKMDRSMRIGDVKERFEDIYDQHVSIVSHTKSTEEAIAAAGDKGVIQLTYVQPFFEQEVDPSSRVTDFERSINLS